MTHLQNQPINLHPNLMQLAVAAEQLLPPEVGDVITQNVHVGNDNMYVAPCVIRHLIPNITYDDFVNLYQEQIGDHMNHFQFYQYYIRYLACSGRLNEMFAVLLDIQNNYFDEEQFQDFLNDTSFEEFNHEPFVFMFIRWNTHITSLERLVDMGCRLNIPNPQNQFPEDFHFMPWTNPFLGILDIPGFPAEFTIGMILETYNIPLEPQHVLLRLNNQIKVVQRHYAHFTEFIDALHTIIEQQH